MKKNPQDIAQQAFKQPIKQENYYYPVLSIQKKPSEFDKLVYVASCIFNPKPKNSFNHAIDISPFRPITPKKNKYKL